MTKNELHKRFSEAVRAADRAGRAAVAAKQVVPMVVGEATSLFSDEIDYSKPTYFVADGACGFAWITVRSEKGPDGSESRRFERWLKGQVTSLHPARFAFGALGDERGWYHDGCVCNEPRRGYYGGTQIWVGGFGQSVQKKEAYAEAFAAVIGERIAGCHAYAGSRLD